MYKCKFHQEFEMMIVSVISRWEAKKWNLELSFVLLFSKFVCSFFSTGATIQSEKTNESLSIAIATWYY
jgi:hypothetical protein